MPDTSRRLQVPGFTKVLRLEHQFKQTLGILKADHLYVRQVAENAFMIAARDPATQTEYVLSPSRNPTTPRYFTNLGRCVQLAVRMSGLKTIHFELLDEPLVEVNGD